MTQSTEKLVRAFLTLGGKVDHIPRGLSGEVVWKGWFKRGRAHTRKMQEAKRARAEAIMQGADRGQVNCGSLAAVDVFIKFRNDKGI